MDPAEILRSARARALLTQRQLAQRSGIPQSVVAAIESGRREPRFTTLDRLVLACGFDLDMVDHGGETVTEQERKEIRYMLSLTPAQRLARVQAMAKITPIRPKDPKHEFDLLVALNEERQELGLDRGSKAAPAHAARRGRARPGRRGPSRTRAR